MNSQRFFTSFVGRGLSCWGPNELAIRGPWHTAPPSPQTALKWYATSVRAVQHLTLPSQPVCTLRIIVSVVRAYEEVFFYGGLAPSLKSVVPRTLGLTDFQYRWTSSTPWRHPGYTLDTPWRHLGLNNILGWEHPGGGGGGGHWWGKYHNNITDTFPTSVHWYNIIAVRSQVLN